MRDKTTGAGSGRRNILLALLVVALVCLAAAGYSRERRREERASGALKSELVVAAAPVVGAGENVASAGVSAGGPERPAAAGKEATLGEKYPRLAAGALYHARPVELADEELLRAGDLAITRADLEAEIGRASPDMRDQLRLNAFFILEQMAGERLLAREAGVADKGGDADIGAYLRGLTIEAKVNDREVADFYARNRDLVGQAPLEQVQEQVRRYLLQEKQQAILERHIRDIGRRTPVLVSAGWAVEQARLARDNPVDRALDNGRPTFANFGAKGCVPCDMMEPVREAIARKYQGKLNVVFIHVNQEQVLASRYGVQSIPTLVFFDAEGEEVFRHTGYLPQEEIERKLTDIGIK